MTAYGSISRRGIAAAGNWIVDRVKMIDRLPGRGMLGSILSETRATGGAPASVLMDLARMGAPFPLAGWGAVGRDADGEFMRESARALGIDVSGVTVVEDAPTSYTDVMCEVGSGDRTFFICRGANSRFGPEHVAIDRLQCRLFHFGYILLLDRMDQPHDSCGTVAASLLQAVRAAGIRTSVDVVSEDSDRFRRLVPPALRHTDYLIVNEIEAARVTGRTVRRGDGSLDGPELARAVEALYEFGDMELVAVHMPEGAYMRDRQGRRVSLGSFVLPDGFIQGTVGAGDAFCAGMLYAIHEGLGYEVAGEMGMACATACLSHCSATEGVTSIAEMRRRVERFSRRPPPVDL